MNEILRKVGNKETIVLSLCSSFCTPMLLYGIEAMNLTKTEKQILSSPFNRMLSRLFKSFDKKVIRSCQFYTSYLPLSYTMDLRRRNFLSKLKSCGNMLMHLLSKNAENYVNELCHCYNLIANKPGLWRNSMWNHFTLELVNAGYS